MIRPSDEHAGEFSSVDPEVGPWWQDAAQLSTILSHGARAARLVWTFFLGQGALQAVQVLTGLLLIRWLSVEAWAQYGLANGFQLTMSSLMDLGISSTIIPLVGERRGDPELVGRYVKAAKYLRDWTFWILVPFTTVCFLAITYKHHWDWRITAVLLGSILLTLHASGRMSCFSAPLILFRRLYEFYTPQTISGIARIGVYVLCRALGALNAWTAAVVAALTVVVNGRILDHKSRIYLRWPERKDAAINREVIQYILPATPAIIFAAFQGQISLFLISVFGNTTSVAQVAALGKLGQLFAILMTFNVVVVEPFIASVNRKRLAAFYFGFLVVASLLGGLVTGIAFAMPRPFLWLLGPNYEGLSNLVGWVVLSACMNYVAGLMWIMNRARKWVFWSGSLMEIFLILAIQFAFVLLVGVHTTRNAVFLAFASSFGYLATHGYVAAVGFLRGPRKIPEPSSISG